MVEWIASNLKAYQPSLEEISKAVRHLGKVDRRNLYSNDYWYLKNAEGNLYEAVIYEKMISLSEQPAFIGSIVRKGADVPYRFISIKDKFEGMFYAKDGRIVARGMGQDLAEFDLLLKDNKGKIAFVEIMNSSNNLREFDKEIAYKKNLLGALFKQEDAPLLLVSSKDITHKKTIIALLKNPNNKFVQTAPFNGIATAGNINSQKTNTDRNNLIYVTDLKLFNINYLTVHNELRNKIMAAVTKNDIGLIDCTNKPLHKLVLKVFIGRLSPEAVRMLCESWELYLGNQRLSPDMYKKDFSGIILALSMPELRPVLYVRGKKKRVYVKLGPCTINTFHFEKNIIPFTSLYEVLERFDREIGPEYTAKLLKFYLSDQVTRNMKKRLDYPKIMI